MKSSKEGSMSFAEAYLVQGGLWALRGIAFVGGVFLVRYVNEVYDKHLSMDKKQLPNGNNEEI